MRVSDLDSREQVWVTGTGSVAHLTPTCRSCEDGYPKAVSVLHPDRPVCTVCG